MKKAIVVATVILTSTLIADLANAQDTKTYPGIACSNDFTRDGEPRKDNGRIENESTTNRLSVTCPISRDIITSDTWDSLTIHVFDGDSSSKLTCEAIVHDNGGSSFAGAFWSSGNVSTGISFTGEDDLTIPAPSVNTLGAVFYSIRCDLPRDNGSRSQILGYTVEEN